MEERQREDRREVAETLVWIRTGGGRKQKEAGLDEQWNRLVSRMPPPAKISGFCSWSSQIFRTSVELLPVFFI